MNLIQFEETKSPIRWLFQLRWGIVTIVLFAYSTGRAMDYLSQKFYMLIFMITLIFGLYNAFIGFLLEEKKSFSSKRVLIELLIDQIYLFLILYLSGGTTNPIIDILAIPLLFSGLILDIHLSILFFIPYVLGLVILNQSFYPIWNHDFTVYDTPELAGKILCNILLFSAIHWINYQLKKVQKLVLQLAEKEDHRKRFDLLGMFAQSFCHKLSTPINTIKMRSDRLVRTLTDEKLQEEVLHIKFASEKAAESLKDFNKLSFAQDVKEEVFDLGLFIEEISQAYQLQNELTIQLAKSHSLEVKLSKNELSHLLYDLFDNAREANATKVELSYYTENEKLYFHLCDNGDGLPPESFTRVLTGLNSTKELGMGLGLYHAKSFCEMNGGKLELLEQEKGLGILLVMDVLYDTHR